MPPPVIKVENLSKRYRIGQKEKRKDTLFGQIGSTLRAPIDNFRRLRSLSKFKEDDESVFWALRDINFEVQQGEVLGIIGHNGAGKSTLLKILSRITEPTSGRISITGRIGALLEVGTGFHPELTGRDNIYMNGTILGMTRKEIDRKLDEIVDFSGVEKYIDTPVKFYSSGMKVRLGFAVAAHLEPEILVIDEVLAVGDAEFQRKCLGKMEDVATQGRTILFVSHNMAAVENICQKGMVLANGGILFKGFQSEAIHKYLMNLEEKSSHVSLLGKKERKGNGLIRFTKVEFRNSSAKPIKTISSGEDLEIHLHFKKEDNTIIENYHVGLTFYNELGVPVFSQSTRVMQVNFGELPQKGIFVCKIKNLALPPSVYFLSINIKVSEEYSDFIEKAVSFSVVDGDFFGTGKIFPSKLGVYLVHGHWKLVH